MSCLQFQLPLRSLDLPGADETALVSIPRALGRLEAEPRAVLDEIVAISRALPDGRDTARLIDVALDYLVVPRFASVARHLNVYAILTEARRPVSFGKFPHWPSPAKHRALVTKHFGEHWTDQLLELIPRSPAPAEPDRWMLMSWLEAFEPQEQALLPALRHWAERAAREGRRELAWSLTWTASKRFEHWYRTERELLNDVYEEQAARFEDLGWQADAYRTRFTLAAWNRVPLPPRPRLTVAPSGRTFDVARSLLEEASAELEQLLYRPMDATEEVSGLPPIGQAARLARVRDLWLSAGYLDRERLEIEVPQVVGRVRSENHALALEMATFALEAATAHPDLAPALTALLRALAAWAKDDRHSLDCGTRMMRHAEQLGTGGRAVEALPLAVLARHIALRDARPEYAAERLEISRRLVEAARAARDPALAQAVLISGQ